MQSLDAWPRSAGEAEKNAEQKGIRDHTAALDEVLRHLDASFPGDIRASMQAVGHRVVHGHCIPSARLVDDEVKEAIEEAASLAPLHNPANLQGIVAASAVFPCPQVAVFDTAFHQTMPPSAYTYALPAELCQFEGLRRYGAHGTSYSFLLAAAARMLGRDASSLNLIACHIGAGASMCCIQGGKSIDTTMGLTPLEGLVMATRCGDIDPAVVIFLAKHCGMSVDDIDKLMNKQSGFLGMCGSTDLRAVLGGIKQGDSSCQLALDVFIQRIRKYLGAYLVKLEGKVDAIIFSAGIGENNALVRQLALQALEPFGVEVDASRNEAAVGVEAEIQVPSSRVKVLVIPTDEELSIAQQTVDVVRSCQLAPEQ
mmetsp:Transcript_13439/g.40646  ORF Transcript_13439/g.40646 Transcript_13439/m.40646 type:complete len:369 (+) Transcript_13439:481-1587(+)